ncbi:MAG: copper-binding protein [Maricaulis sp.]|jgi:CopA family copper-resistance protein|nr:copper-binding protein [Maricaulis sp.]HAQ36818.1 copper resistance system multicopper oxidase [Alphaproteobacteria bacterium]
MFSRRTFLQATASTGGALAASSLIPAWAQSGPAANLAGLRPLSGTEFDLTIGRSQLAIDGRVGPAITVNGQVPAPLLRWREGEDITLRVHNTLDTDTSIHWHGILLPNEMDGVPGVTFPGIRPGQTFTYRFPVTQAGTYWYHSHSGLQEQMGHYGPIVIEPRGTDPVGYDREYVIVLSDYTFEGPHHVFQRLMASSDTYNFQQRTVPDFFRDASQNGFMSALRDRLMWGQMRMSPTDISDVTAATLDFLMNGHGPADNWTGLFEPGERVRLRFINASAMTFFNVRIPGLPMTVVQCDGLDVQPVETDEFQIGVAETYDVVVQPREDRAYTLMCETIDRSGYVRGTLAPRMGMTAPVPPLRPRPTLTMRDMGMDHGSMSGMDHGAAPASDPHAAMGHGAQPAADPHAAMGHGSMSGMDHSAHGAPPSPAPAAHDHGAHGGGETMTEHNHPQGPGVANVAMQPVSRLHEPGAGLEDVPHRALAYSQLRSLAPNPDQRAPAREIEVHLTSNMERYMWSFDGTRFSEVVEPIEFIQGERLRLTMVNDTMMVHPIHLHGMFFEVVNGESSHKPRKHTINVKPGEKLSVDVTPEHLGDWAFHCHLLYHMHAGMFQVVSVRAGEAPPAHSGHHMQHGDH